MRAEIGRKQKINAGLTHFARAEAEVISRRMTEPHEDYDFWECVIDVSWRIGKETAWIGTNPHFLIQRILAYHSHFIDDRVWLDDGAIKDDIDTAVVCCLSPTPEGVRRGKDCVVRLKVIYRRKHAEWKASYGTRSVTV